MQKEKRSRGNRSGCVGGGRRFDGERKHVFMKRMMNRECRYAACVCDVWRDALIIVRGLWTGGVLMSINENRPTLRETKVLPFNDI